MTNLLEKLWYSYQMQDDAEQNGEEKELLDLIVLYEEKLHAVLNAEQMERLKNIGNASGIFTSLPKKKPLSRAFVLQPRF